MLRWEKSHMIGLGVYWLNREFGTNQSGHRHCNSEVLCIEDKMLSVTEVFGKAQSNVKLEPGELPN